METIIILTGILKSKDEYLAVKRSEDDILFPGSWEFPGGHLEVGETLKEGLKRELKEEIGFNKDFNPKIIGYDDEIRNKNNMMIHHIEINFLIEVKKEDIIVKLSDEHTEYAWLKKDSELFDDYIKSKLVDIK